jgi:hypothetical protein
VERTGQAVPGDRCFAAGYMAFPASLVMEGPSPCHEEGGGRGGFVSPFLVLPLLVPLMSFPQTLAAGAGSSPSSLRRSSRSRVIPAASSAASYANLVEGVRPSLLLPGHKDPTMVASSDVELSRGDGDLAACIRSAGTHPVPLPSTELQFLIPCWYHVILHAPGIKKACLFVKWQICEEEERRPADLHPGTVSKSAIDLLLSLFPWLFGTLILPCCRSEVDQEISD